MGLVQTFPKSLDDRIAMINEDIFVESEQRKEIAKELEWRLNMLPRRRCPGILILGPSGAGKTNLMEDFAAEHRGRVVRFDMTAVTSRREFVDELGQRLNHPISLNRDLRETVKQMCEAMEIAGYLIAFFDDLQDLFELKRSDRNNILLLMKLIANETSKFFLCVAGSENAAGLIETNRHLKSRLLPFTLKFTGREDLHAFLYTIVSYFPLAEPSLIFDKDTLDQVLSRSSGNTERIVLSARYAAIHALKKGEEAIDRDCFLTRLLL